MDPDSDHNQLPSIDLHRFTEAQAVRALGRELHAARVRRVARILAITGRGYGNKLQQPVLRTAIEQWLRGADAARLGVRGFRRVHQGGALEISLGVGSDPDRTSRA